MFDSSYWPENYWPANYWPEGSAAQPAATPGVSHWDARHWDVRHWDDRHWVGGGIVGELPNAAFQFVAHQLYVPSAMSIQAHTGGSKITKVI